MQQNQLPAEPDPWMEEDPDALEEYDDKGALDRFAEVFTSPSDAFYGLERSPRRGSIITWGMVIGVVVVLFSVILMYANPEIINAMMNKSLAKIERQHDAGEMTDQQYEQTVKMMESGFKGEGIMKFIPFITGPIVSAIGWAIAGALLYGVARSMQSDDRKDLLFSTALATYMIALMIALLEQVIYAIGMYFTGDVGFSLDPNLMVRSEDIMVRFALGLFGPLTLWWFYVVGTGIATISGGSRNKAIGIWVAIFIVLQGGMTYLRSLFSAM